MTTICTPYDYRRKLACDLSATDTILKIKDDGKLDNMCNELGADKHTYLVLSDCVRRETVKVTCDCGMLVMERTDGQAWSAGDTVAFHMTPEVSTEALACYQEENGTLPVKVESDTLVVTTPDPDDPQCFKVELKPDPDKVAEFCVPGFDIAIDQYGCAVVTENASTELEDGKYTNATVCIEGGKLKSLAVGSPVVANACGGCCKCAETETP